MSAFLPAAAAKAVHWWVRLYTLALPPRLRDDRWMEIRSDLWEQTQAASLSGLPSSRAAWLMLRRLALGVPADLAWRVETGGLASQTSGLLFAALAAIGFQMALRGPGIPDSGVSAGELNAFFANNGAQLMAGHVLLSLSAVVFIHLAVHVYRLLVDGQRGIRWLSTIVLSSGVAAGVLLVLTFVFTAIVALLGANGDVEMMRTLYPLAGFIFHVPMSIAITVFLTATAVLCLRTQSLPGWTGPAGIMLAFIFALESLGSTPVYLLPQALFLVWAVTMGATIRRGALATQ